MLLHNCNIMLWTEWSNEWTIFMVLFVNTIIMEISKMPRMQIRSYVCASSSYIWQVLWSGMWHEMLYWGTNMAAKMTQSPQCWKWYHRNGDHEFCVKASGDLCLALRYDWHSVSLFYLCPRICIAHCMHAAGICMQIGCIIIRNVCSTGHAVPCAKSK